MSVSLANNLQKLTNIAACVSRDEDWLMLAKCYKCDTTIQTHIDMVHPICDECYNYFEDWLARELAILDNAVSK